MILGRTRAGLVTLVLAAIAAAPLARPCAAAPALGHSERSEPWCFSAFATPQVGGRDAPEPLLAQRSITREWGLSEDSTYSELELPNWKSEGGALAASAVLPGVGQLYTGEGSGWWYLLAEAGGWVGLHLSDRKADRYRDQAASFVGNPEDTLAVFSFERLEDGGGDPSRLRQLWAADRESFYESIANDPSLQAGFRAQDGSGFAGYTDLRDRSDRTLRQSRMVQLAIWANHLLSAWDALRAARFHNLPLQQNLDVKVSARWNRGGPNVRAALQRRF